MPMTPIQKVAVNKGRQNHDSDGVKTLHELSSIVNSEPSNLGMVEQLVRVMGMTAPEFLRYAVSEVGSSPKKDQRTCSEKGCRFHDPEGGKTCHTHSLTGDKAPSISWLVGHVVVEGDASAQSPAICISLPEEFTGMHRAPSRRMLPAQGGLILVLRL